MKHLATLACLFTAVAATAYSSEPAAFTATVTGHGRPMILIPGLSCPGAVWDSTVAHFKDDYECHVLSLAGFGGVPAQPGPFLAPKRDAIAAYIRDHKLEHPIVVGHSLGGFLALDLAAKNPELTGPLVVVDAYPFLAALRQPGIDAAGAQQAAEGMRDMIASMDEAAYAASLKSGRSTRTMVASDADHEKIVAWGLASDRTATLAAMTEMYSTDLRPSLPAIQSPALVLVTWIAYKPFVDHPAMELAARDQYAHLAGAQIAVTDAARHFIMFDDPQWMFAQIETFLASEHGRGTK